MARKLTQKQVDKVLVEYNLSAKIVALMGELGAYAWRRPEEVWPEGGRPEFFRPSIESYRDFVILTRGGMLGVSLAPVFTDGPEALRLGGDAVFCVFAEPEEARFFVWGGDVSRPSGKWNHHAFVAHCHGPTSRAEMIEKLDRMWDGFRKQIAALVPGVLS